MHVQSSQANAVENGEMSVDEMADFQNECRGEGGACVAIGVAGAALALPGAGAATAKVLSLATKGLGVGASRLVGANRAVIDPRKLTEYALNPNHPVGGNKAKVFESALGFNQSNASALMTQLQKGVMNVTPVAGKVDKFGARFTLDIPVTGPLGSGTVRTGWIYKPGSNTPELTTLFVK